jgi:hypothetical protein
MSWQAAFAHQAKACNELGSPFTGMLLQSIATRGLPNGPIADRIAAWPGDITARGASVPLRLAGAMHGLVLEGLDPHLASLYPPATAAPTELELWQAVSNAIIKHADWIDHRLNRTPQTNEVARSVALIAISRWLTDKIGLPIVLSEFGASAGLNLFFDRYALEQVGRLLGPADPVLTLRPDWIGPPLSGAGPKITGRAGVDLAPPDLKTERLRMLSYIWPDQPDRLARTNAALEAAAKHEPAVTKGDAIDWLETRLKRRHVGQLHLIFHTIAWQYFPTESQERGEDLLVAAGENATADAPLARFSMEADAGDRGAGLCLTLWPGGKTHAFGRFDFHGRWIDWQPPF